MSDIRALTKAKIPCEGNGIEVKNTLCDICCPVMHCGVTAYVKDGKIIKMEGTKDHPWKIVHKRSGWTSVCVQGRSASDSTSPCGRTWRRKI